MRGPGQAHMWACLNPHMCGFTSRRMRRLA